MELKELLDSKTFVKENSMLDFKHPKEYVQPFVDKVSKLTENFKIEVSNKITNKNEEDSTENTSYGRFKIEATLPEKYSACGAEGTIGMIVALDSGKPMIRVFTGKNVTACINLTIFNADDVYSQELSGNVHSIYGKIENYVNIQDQRISEFTIAVNKLQAQTFSGSSLNEFTGKLIHKALRNPKLGHTLIVQGTRELINPKSVYYAKNGETTAWNYYNSITEYIKGSDILERPSKTLILSELFLN